jgi:peptidoglycan/LPS O-acetylase OafA/YrhL
MIVFGHVGGFWFFPPWSEFLQVFVPIFFFISGAVSYDSFIRSKSTVHYLKKRIFGILVPYYCICIFSLLVYLVINRSLPSFSVMNVVKWLTIIPDASIMSFPLGQVWFLHTLLIICLVSPLFFYLYRRRSVLLPLFMLFAITASSLQVAYKISPYFIILGNNFFKPIVHSLFFCLGFIMFDSTRIRSNYFSIAAVIFFSVLSYLLVAKLALNPDYEFHTYAPDIYYVAGSLCAIWFCMLARPSIMKIYYTYRFVQPPAQFLFRNTFAIYLLQSFAIYFVEKNFNLVHPQQKTIIYGIIKLSAVLAITLAMSPIFTNVSSSISRKLLSASNRTNA